MKKLITILILIAAIMALAIVGYLLVFKDRPVIGSGKITSVDRQVIDAVESKEEVVLLALGIEGIHTAEYDGTNFFGLTIPGTERVKFLQYSFDGKLGLNGADVAIEASNEHTYRVVVPAFEFIGFDDPEFKAAIDKNGVLSWFSPELSETLIINEILSPDHQHEYVIKYDELLRAQATQFYTNIITSIDPEAIVNVEFSEDARQ